MGEGACVLTWSAEDGTWRYQAAGPAAAAAAEEADGEGEPLPLPALALAPHQQPVIEWLSPRAACRHAAAEAAGVPGLRLTVAVRGGGLGPAELLGGSGVLVRGPGGRLLPYTALSVSLVEEEAGEAGGGDESDKGSWGEDEEEEEEEEIEAVGKEDAEKNTQQQQQQQQRAGGARPPPPPPPAPPPRPPLYLLELEVQAAPASGLLQLEARGLGAGRLGAAGAAGVGGAGAAGGAGGAGAGGGGGAGVVLAGAQLLSEPRAVVLDTDPQLVRAWRRGGRERQAEEVGWWGLCQGRTRG